MFCFAEWHMFKETHSLSVASYDKWQKEISKDQAAPEEVQGENSAKKVL